MEPHKRQHHGLLLAGHLVNLAACCLESLGRGLLLARKYNSIMCTSLKMEEKPVLHGLNLYRDGQSLA